jgi:hypothetical protein
MNTKDYRLTIADFNLEDTHYRTHQAASFQTHVNITNPFLYDAENNNTMLLVGDTATKTINDYFSVFNPIKSSSTETGILPPGVKIIGTNYLVFEKPPTFKNIFYVPASKSDVPDDCEDLEQVYRIPIPWQLYFVKFNPNMYTYEVRMFFMKSSLSSTDQELFLPPIPNFYTDGLLCSPTMSNMEDVDRYPKNHTGIIQSAYDWVWNSGTNHDLTEACLHLSMQLPQSQTILKNIPEQVYQFNFPTSSTSMNRYSASPGQIKLMLSVWEKFSLSDVCEMSWPNVSGPTRTFDYRNDSVRDQSAYYDNLADYLSDRCDEEDIDAIMENDDYDHGDYVSYLLDNGLITIPSGRPWDITYTYSSLLPHLIAALSLELNTADCSFEREIQVMTTNNV